MPELDIKIVLEWFGAIILSVGGTGVIVIAISKWFGDRLATKLLEQDRAKYQREFEGIKRKYQEELEIKKNELEKSKSLFLRYSEHQFNLYNELWKSLCDLKHIGEELWERADPQLLKKFSKQLRETKLTVEKSALLIEDNHYKSLIDILDKFGSFEIGKLTLITLRNRTVHEMNEYGVREIEIRRLIDDNGQTKQEFVDLTEQLSLAFKNQIKGEE
jgi:hypothetical protein